MPTAIVNPRSILLESEAAKRTKPGPGLAMKPSASSASPWSPFTYSVFRALWLATLVSNVGTFMQSVGAAWLMTSLSTSAVMVALVQAASIFPIFLLSLPAGALADIIDRRRLLLASQAWMMIAAALLATLTLQGHISPWLLLGFTFLLGLGAAMNAPAWQAIVPELVPRPELPQAISLNSAGFNLSRAVGPALGGAVVAAAGAGVTFVLNAVSFLGVLLVLYRWQRPAINAALPAERMVAAIYTGLRYVRHSPGLKAVLWRTGIFIIFTSSLWALLPLVVRYEMGGSSADYGILLGCFGAGAVAGAALMPKMQRYLPVEALLAGMTVIAAAMIALTALVPRMAYLVTAMVLSGASWLVMLSLFNVAIQIAVPGWVRARVLAVYMLVFAGGLSAGSAAWGAVATRQGLKAALLYSAGGVLLGLLAAIRYRVILDEDLDLTPSLQWPEPHLLLEPRPEQGPVLVTIEYLIDPSQSDQFGQAMRALKVVRRRDGAIRWGLFQDTANPGRFLETFIVETWIEHRRQHERMTVADRRLEEQVFSFHIGEDRPRVSHLIYAYGRRGRSRKRVMKSLK
jgi:MFS family permease/quinol monooxygenase YgiN